MPAASKKKNAAGSKKSKSTKGVAEPTALVASWGWVLLFFCLGDLLVLQARIAGGVEARAADILHALGWMVGSGVFVSILRVSGYRGGKGLPVAILCLTAVGVVVRTRIHGYSSGAESFVDLALVPVGFMLLTAAWAFSRKGRLTHWRPLAPWAFVVSLGLVFAVALLGQRFRGAAFAPGNLTPTELLKILVPFSLAGFLASREKKWAGKAVWGVPIGQSILLAGLWGLLALGLVIQRDMGMLAQLSGVLGIVVLCMCRHWSWLVVAVAGTAGATAGLRAIATHAPRRIQAWLDPFSDPTGAGWQVLQGLSGLYAGGLFGTGLGGGRPDRIPIASSDFIYAVWGEEMGFVGSLLLLGFFAAFLHQAGKVVRNQSDTFLFVAGAGWTTAFAAQIFINIGGVVTVLPITGIPLPFVSHGGTSLWVSFVLSGFLLGLGDFYKNK